MTSEAHPQQLIIVRRHDDEEHDHHSSAWKVAHADFMTAMMAFFLIMWLINVTDDEVKKSIANYFNPVKLSESVTNRKGLNARDAIEPQGPAKPGDEKTTLAPPAGAKNPGDEGADRKSSGKDAANSSAAGSSEDPAAKAERAAFRDPYSVLDKLAAEVPTATTSGDVALGEDGPQGAVGNDVARDPFDPVYWQMRQAEGGRTNETGVAGKAEKIPASGKPDATALRANADPAADVGAMRPSLSADAAGPLDADPATQLEASAVEAKLTAALAARLAGSEAPHLEVKATQDGVLINLTDDARFSMFEIGSAIPKPTVVVAMEKVAEVLAERPGDIIIRGYTDGRPFHSGTYDNWRLSTARAHMAYYMLARGGLPDARVLKIEGLADRNLKNPQDPNAAENRRIEILLLGRES